MPSGQALAYLDSVRELYPGGIPVDSIFRPTVPERIVQAADREWCVSGSVASGLAIVAVASEWEQTADGEPFGGADGELLRTVITQAFKLETGKVLSIMGKASKNCPACGLEFVQKYKPAYILVCGEGASVAMGLGEGVFSRERGNWMPVSDAQIMISHSLADVRTNSELKKVFWTDIKKILGRL